MIDLLGSGSPAVESGAAREEEVIDLEDEEGEEAGARWAAPETQDQVPWRYVAGETEEDAEDDVADAAAEAAQPPTAAITLTAAQSGISSISCWCGQRRPE